jgi:hypothetical protein
MKILWVMGWPSWFRMLVLSSVSHVCLHSPWVKEITHILTLTGFSMTLQAREQLLARKKTIDQGTRTISRCEEEGKRRCSVMVIFKSLLQNDIIQAWFTVVLLGWTSEHQTISTRQKGQKDRIVAWTMTHDMAFWALVEISVVVNTNAYST